MKRIDKIYKRLLLREDFPSDGIEDVPSGTIQTWPGPNGTINQDITVPNLDDPDIIPGPNPHPTPPRADPRIRDIIIKPYLLPPPGLHRGWDPWLPGQDMPPAYWPRTPTGLPLPQFPPPGWPNNQPWPPPPGHPLYHILEETYQELGWIFHQTPWWISLPHTDPQMIWDNLPQSAKQKIYDQIGIKLWDMNADTPFMPIIPLTLKWILMAACWELAAPYAVWWWLYDLGGHMLPIHQIIQDLQDWEPNLNSPYLQAIEDVGDVGLEILQWTTPEENAWPKPHQLNDPPASLPIYPWGSTNPKPPMGWWWNIQTGQWEQVPIPNVAPVYPKQQGDKFFWGGMPRGWRYDRPGPGGNQWFWDPTNQQWIPVGHRFRT